MADTWRPTLTAALTCLVGLGCASPDDPAPSANSGGSASAAGASSTSGGGGAPLVQGGSAGSAGAGGVTMPTSTAGSSGAGGAVAGSGGSGGSGGMSGENPPDGVPRDYTLQLDLPFSSADSLTALLAGNQSAWTFDPSDGGSIEFTGSGYTAPAPVNESLSSFAVLSSTKFASFVLDVELMQLNRDTTQPHRDLCIVFNAADHKHFYYAHIAATHDERSHNIHLIDNAPREPITATQTNGIQWGEAGSWHKVRLVRDSVMGNIAVYWDGQLDSTVLTANDTTFTTGYIGFGTFMDSGKLRNLKVWAKTVEKVPTQAFFE